MVNEAVLCDQLPIFVMLFSLGLTCLFLLLYEFMESLLSFYFLLKSDACIYRERGRESGNIYSRKDDEN